MTTAIADEAPTASHVTDYDKACLKLYLRLLDAAAAGATWDEVARRLLETDPGIDPDRSRRRYETHLARAHWMTDQGYLDLLKSGL